jgi:ribose 5-phosphate isomerase B
MKLAIGCDEAAYDLKETIKKYAAELGHEVEDYGVYNTDPVLYPDIAYQVATVVAAGKHERGILICGTGIGMAITANKVPGIRAAVCHDAYSTERSVLSNDCQVMTMGSRVIGEETAKTMVKIWLGLTFKPGRSTAKVQRICDIEREFNK